MSHRRSSSVADVLRAFEESQEEEEQQRHANGEPLPKGSEILMREQRAMLDVELRSIYEAAKSLHIPSESGTSPSSSVPFRERDRPVIDSLPLRTTLDDDETIRLKTARRMDEILRVPSAPPLHFTMDSLVSECSSVGSLRNDSWSTLLLLLSFHTHYLSTLDTLHYKLTHRFVQHATSNQVLERYGPRFSAALVCVNKQYERILHRFMVLKETWRRNGGEEEQQAWEEERAHAQPPTDWMHAWPGATAAAATVATAAAAAVTTPAAAASASSTAAASSSAAAAASVSASPPSSSSASASTPRSAGVGMGGPSSLPSGPAPGSIPALPPKNLGWESVMLKSDLEELVRYALPRVNTRQRVARFLTKLRWIHASREAEIEEGCGFWITAPHTNPHAATAASSTTGPVGSAGDWSTPRATAIDLSEPPHFRSPRALDLLPHNLTTLEEVDAENARLRSLWLRELAAHDGGGGDEHPPPPDALHRSTNPFAESWSRDHTTPGDSDRTAPWEREWNPSGEEESTPASTRTRAPPSMFDGVSRVFARIFLLQSMVAPARLRPYAALLDPSDAGDAALLAAEAAHNQEEELSALTEEQISARRVARSKADLEVRRAAALEAKEKRAVAEQQRAADAASNGSTGLRRPTSTLSTSGMSGGGMNSSALPLRDTNVPIISSTGKIWGGKAMNNFKIKDEKEMDAVLAGGVVVGGSVGGAGNAGHPAAAGEVESAQHPGSGPDGRPFVREDSSQRMGGGGVGGEGEEQPIKSFTFSSQKQEELLSDPSRIFSDGQKSSGGIDRKIVAPKVYLRKATFLRHTRIFPTVVEHLVSQRQTLREYATSSAIDVQLKRHYHFIIDNDNVPMCSKQLARLVQEHLSLLELPGSAAAQEAKPTNHRKSSLALMYDGDGRSSDGASSSRTDASSGASSDFAAAAASASAFASAAMHGPGSGPGSGSGSGSGSSGASYDSSHVELEVPAHKLQALYMLRVLRVRELRSRILGLLNYFRSVHKVLCKDETLYTRQYAHSGSAGQPARFARFSGYNPVGPGPAGGGGGAGAPPSAGAAYAHPQTQAGLSSSHLYDPSTVISRLSTRTELEDRCDEWEWERSGSSSGGGGSGGGGSGGSGSGELIVVRDARKKVRIVYDAALRDLGELEQDLLALASVYIERHQYAGMGMKGDVDTEVAAYQSLLHSLDGGAPPSAAAMAATAAAAANVIRDRPEGMVAQAGPADDADPFYPDPLLISSKTRSFGAHADRWSLLVDLFEREHEYQRSKRALLEVLYEAYSHCIDAGKMRGLAQKMVDLLSARPHFDLDRSVSSFAPTYLAESALLRGQARLFREIMYAQLEEEVLRGGSVPIHTGSGGTAGSGGGGGGSAAAPGATGSSHAAFDWSLFSTEYTPTSSDPLNTLSSLHIYPSGPSLSHPLTHPHILLQFRASFDALLDVVDEFDRAVSRVESALPLPKKKVRSIYLVRIRQALVDNTLHVFRTHMSEEASFPASQHLSTLETLDQSPFLTNVPYALAKLAVNFAAMRAQGGGGTHHHHHHHHHHAQTTGDGTRSGGGGGGGGGGAGGVTGAGMRRHGGPARDAKNNVTDGAELQLYQNYIEVYNIRTELLSALYESVVMTRVYFSQAERVGIDAPRTLLDMRATSGIVHGGGGLGPPMGTGNGAISATRGAGASVASGAGAGGGGVHPSGSSFLHSSGAGELGCFAISEVLHLLPKDLFKRLQELDKGAVLLAPQTVSHLRSMLALQLAHNRVLATVIDLHAALAAMDEVAEEQRKRIIDALPPNLRALARRKNLGVHATTTGAGTGAGGGAGGGTSGGGGVGGGTTLGSSGSSSSMLTPQPFVRMIAEIQAAEAEARRQQQAAALGAASTPLSSSSSKTPHAQAKPSPSPRVHSRSLNAHTHAHAQRIRAPLRHSGALTPESFVSVYSIKLAARLAMEEFLAISSAESARAAVAAQAQTGSSGRGGGGGVVSSLSPSGASSPSSSLSPGELILLYTRHMFQALAPETYVLELVVWARSMRAQHATGAGAFGGLSPFQQSQAFAHGAGGGEALLEHLLTPKSVTDAAAATQTGSSQPLSPRASSSSSSSGVGGGVGADDLPLSGARWGGGGGPLSHPSTGSSYSSLYQIPHPASLVALLRLDRAVLNPAVLREDILCRKTLQDTAALQLSLAQLEHLSSLSLNGTRVAELASTRLDSVRNDLRELCIIEPGYAGPSFPSVRRLLSLERLVAWYRMHALFRFVYEALLVKEDELGVEFVRKVVRVVQGQNQCAGASRRQCRLGGVEAPAMEPLIEPYRGGAHTLRGCWDPFTPAYPATSMHGLPGLFSFFCDARVSNSFAGLGRELSHMNKLVFRMGKEVAPTPPPVSSANGASAGAASAQGVGGNAAPALAVPDPTAVAIGRAQRTADTMRQALALSQMFDAFYLHAFELERRNAQQGQQQQPQPSSALPHPPASPSSSSSLPSDSSESDPWHLPSHPCLTNPAVPLFISGGLYMRALEVADVNLVSKVNAVRKRENARLRGVVPLAYLAIIERTSHQSAALMAAAAAPDAQPPTSLVLNPGAFDSVHGPSLHLSSHSSSSSSSTTTMTTATAGALNCSQVFGFTLFALGLRPQDQDMILSILRDQFQLDLFSMLVSHARAGLERLRAEEKERIKEGGYARGAMYASLMQSTKLLINEVQDTSYELDVVKEWLASSASSGSSGGGGGAGAGGNNSAASSMSDLAAAGAQGSVAGTGGSGGGGGGSSHSSSSPKLKQFYVLPKSGFNSLLTQLLRDLLQFGSEARGARLHTLDTLNGFLETLLSEKGLMVRALSKELHAQMGEFTAQSLAQVTDTQYQLIMDLQSMREQLVQLHTHAGELDAQLSCRVANEYSARVHKLQLHILHLTSKLDINNLSIRARILAHYYSLKKEALEEMISAGSAPYLIKKRALGILNREAAYQEQKQEHYTLHATALKLATLAQMKTLISSRVHHAEQQSLQDLLRSHTQLRSDVAACEARSAAWTRELQETKNSLMLCHKFLEEVQRAYLSHRRENTKLHAWKSAQLVRLAKLELITKKFEDVSELDFAKLEQELRSKAEEMETALQYERNADLRQQLMQAAQDKKLRQIRRLIQREDRLIQEAHAKIERWEQRCLSAERRAVELRAENDRLRRSLHSQPTTAEEWKQNTAALRSMGVMPPSNSHAKLTPQWKL